MAPLERCGTCGRKMRFVLILFLGLAAAPALAQWVRVDDKDNAIHYIDRATLTRSGDMRRVWITQYVREKGPDGEISRRVLLEYDCAGRRFRYLSSAKHSARPTDAEAPSPEKAPRQPAYVPVPIDDKTVRSVLCGP